ncbi:MAG: hypothetical protein NC204_07590, partial [Candidatus Amulumruptor caecigallinarius]|nr:hypothetical protein [Candidatus Amulumruptor caecigallinarius]
MKNSLKILLGGFIVVIAVLCAVADIILMKKLLSWWFLPAMVVLVFSALLTLPLRNVSHWLVGFERQWLNSVVCGLVIYPVLLLSLLLIDRINAREAEGNMEAVVSRVYKQTRYKTRRVSRRVYARGAPYKVNCIDVVLANGDSRSFDVKRLIYDSVNKGDTIDIPVSTGMVGLKWLESGNVKPRVSHNKKENHNTNTRKNSLIQLSQVCNLRKAMRLEV